MRCMALRSDRPELLVGTNQVRACVCIFQCCLLCRPAHDAMGCCVSLELAITP
jgi:hypothetical protein